MGTDQSRPSIDNKYKEGETVYAKERPSLALIVRRYVHRIYYCKIVSDPNSDEVVYFERELVEKLQTVD